MTRGIQDVDLVASVLESHHGGRYGDTTLLLDLHPVTRRGLLDLVTLDGTCYVDSSPEEKELLGEGRLTGVRVTDDSEGTSLVDLFLIFVHVGDLIMSSVFGLDALLLHLVAVSKHSEEGADLLH